MSGDLITFGVGPQGSVTRLLTFGLEIGEPPPEPELWASVTPASGSWSPVSGASGTWTPATPASTVWT